MTSAGPAAALRRKIDERAATIGVIGLGYVGLPLIAAFTDAGFPTRGFDIDPDKTAQLNAGTSYLDHIPDARIAGLVATGRFAATADFDELADCDAIVICVPTPLAEGHVPDLGFVLETGRAIAGRLREGQLVVLESTSYPGTTEDELRPVLETSGLTAGRDFFLAYSPEREDPGNAEFNVAGIPKLVGGQDADALALAAALYGAVVGRVVEVSSTRVAEAAKLTENIFRAVNIAMVNELKLVYEAMGIDVWEVIAAAATKPFGYMPFWPGPGLGGHCIPIDPFYLAWKAREAGAESRFIELAGLVNDAMPGHVVAKLETALQEAGRALAGARVLLLGLAYKKNIGDTRESPALRIWRLLDHAGARVSYHDDHVPEVPPTREYPELAGIAQATLGPELLAAQDAVVICTDHDGVDYDLLAAHAKLIVDTRNAMAGRAGGPARIVRA